jgi:hypothetical protein
MGTRGDRWIIVAGNVGRFGCCKSSWNGAFTCSPIAPDVISTGCLALVMEIGRRVPESDRANAETPTL